MREASVGTKRFHTFLSYNSIDQLLVEMLAHQLSLNGIHCWLDKWNLVPGIPWQAEIEQALLECETCSVLIGPSGLGPWQHAEMRVAIDNQVSKGSFRVIPVLLPNAERGERSRYPAFLTQTTWVEFRSSIEDPDAIRRLVAGIRGMPPGPGTDNISRFGGCPYRGLQYFDVGHAQIFFGREALTEWLINALRTSLRRVQAARFLAIVGASGSGKSSLVRAGLISEIINGALPDSQNWPVLILRPGPAPFESLAIALKKDSVIGREVGDIGDLKCRLSANIDRLHLLVRLALSGQSDSVRTVLVIDQFEEVFTVCLNPEMRKAFIDSLIYAATEAAGQTIVIITMRADFYGKCAPYEELAAAVSDHQLLVGPMSDLEIREAILRPARLTGCEVDPELVEMLVESVNGEAGGLPLLEYTLTQLWEGRHGTRLTVAAYKDMGKLTGALEKRANQIYDTFSEEEKKACKQIFLRLIQPGEGTEDTKRRAYRTEMGESGALEQVMRALTDERLVTTEGGESQSDAFIEVSHEALIRGWSRLRQWINENRDDLRLRMRLSEAAREWDRKDKERDYLFRGTRLTEVQEWTRKASVALSNLERQFLEASIALRDEEIRISLQTKRRRFVGLTMLVGFIGLLLGAGLLQFHDAQRTKVRLAEILIATQKEAQRTDLTGTFTVFATPYGRESLEKEGRGLFTSQIEKYLFAENTSVARAIALAQSELMTKSDERQRAEILSSMNADVFLNPKNENRRFWALVAGVDAYDGKQLSVLRGAVADATSIHSALQKAGYQSQLLTNPSNSDFNAALDSLLSRASADCKTESPQRGSPDGRGFIYVEEIKPCENTLVFVYLSGHGFVNDGNTYWVTKDAKVINEGLLSDKFLSIEVLRGKIAEKATAQIIIADISRSVFREKR